MANTFDNLVVSRAVLKHLLTRARAGDPIDRLLALCTENATPVEVTPAPAVVGADVDGCCPCRRPWCAGGCQRDGRLTR